MSNATGTVLSITIASAAGAPVASLTSVQAVAGKGLQGDHNYHDPATTPEKMHDAEHEITLIESEKVEAFNAEMGTAFEAGAFRRNIVTRGTDLNALVGREFQVGAATLRGIKLCEPCTTLQRYTDARVLPGLVHKGGLRAEIVEGGAIAVGDPIIVGDPGTAD